MCTYCLHTLAELGILAEVVGAAKSGHLLSGLLAEQVWQSHSGEIRGWTCRQDVTRLSFGGMNGGWPFTLFPSFFSYQPTF